MRLSKCTLYWNTPLTHLNETIHFETTEARDQWLNGFRHLTFDQINFERSRLTLKLKTAIQSTNGVNYCTITNGFDGVTYCYFIMATAQYANDNCTLFELVPDVLMTWTCGNVLNTISNVWIHRQHVTNASYASRLLELRTNSDVLKCTTKRYVHTESKLWKDQSILFHCSFDLKAKFGSVNKPSVTTSKGIVYDHIASPVGLYHCSYDDWTDFCDYIKKYPWVGQAISHIVLIPTAFIDTSDLHAISLNDGDKSGLIKDFQHNGESADGVVLTITKAKIKEYLGWEDDLYLRSEYATLEITSYDGQLMALDLAQLPDSGLKLKMMNVIGYANEVRIYPADWNENGDNDSGVIEKGSFLGQALVFNNWTQLPMLIDNYKLSLASSANQRAYAESRTVSGRFNNLSNTLQSGVSANNAQDLFFDAYSILGGGLHPATLASKMMDDVEFYRQQRAQFADLALTPPSETNASMNHAFQVGNRIFGITIKFSAPSDAEKEKIKRYYATMGYEFEEFGNVQDIHSMTVCNYLKCEGNFVLDDIPAGYFQMLKGLLAQGVRFWHPNGTLNPFKQNVLNNTRRV